MERCDIVYHWLHYNAPSDTAFCHMYMMAEFENNSLARTKTDPVFSNTGMEGSDYSI